MKAGNILKCLAYFNRNDPRIWVYKSEKYKAIGVTLNFARIGSWIWLMALVAFVVGLIGGANRVLQNNCLFAVAAVVAGAVVILTVCYWMAARDLKRYPGLKSARPC